MYFTHRHLQKSTWRLDGCWGPRCASSSSSLEAVARVRLAATASAASWSQAGVSSSAGASGVGGAWLRSSHVREPHSRLSVLPVPRWVCTRRHLCIYRQQRTGRAFEQSDGAIVEHLVQAAHKVQLDVVRIMGKAGKLHYTRSRRLIRQQHLFRGILETWKSLGLACPGTPAAPADGMRVQYELLHMNKDTTSLPSGVW